MLERWELIESDFQREYGIDLSVIDLSWRRFITLLGGMSPDSVFFSVLRDERKNAPIEDQQMILHDIVASMGKK
jgi:hypothetical protein